MLAMTTKEDAWHNQAIKTLNSDYSRSADTSLLKVRFPHLNNIDFYLKDESAHITGSLKYRLAYALFMHGICNGSIRENTTIVEASSGNTAISEAYFADLLGLPFITVVPKNTSLEKIKNIEHYNGKCVFVDSHQISSEALRIAEEKSGYFMDQFSNAEKVTDWRDNNIAASIYQQLEAERFPNPEWFIMSAGTGGTSGTIGRYNKWAHKSASLCVPDPADSIFYNYYKCRDKTITSDSSRVEGIGRSYYVSSFIPDVIDMMVKIPDEASIATMMFFEKVLNRRIGPSAGNNIFASILLASSLHQQGKSGSLVSVICDKGEFYNATYWSEAWRKKQGFRSTDITFYQKALADFYESGKLLNIKDFSCHSIK